MSFGPPPNRSDTSLSVTGEHLRSSSSVTPPKKTYKYKCVSHSSSVDESLFSSHRDQKPSRPDKRTTNESTNPPRTNSAMSTTPPIKNTLNQRPSSRSGYRVKYPKSYVDESLFGPQLEEPSFEAPWADKEDKKRGPTLMWSPPVPGSLLALASTPEQGTELRPRSSAASRPSSAAAIRPSSAAAGRPSSAAGSRPSSAAGRKRPSTPNKPPPWK